MKNEISRTSGEETAPLYSDSPSATEGLGEGLASLLAPGTVLRLEGTLGAGKTTLIRGLARGLGIKDAVTSPSYTLIIEYTEVSPPLYHIDLYRLNRRADREGLGLETYFDGRGITVIEWAEKAHDLLPAEAKTIRLRFLPDPGLDSAPAPDSGKQKEPALPEAPPSSAPRESRRLILTEGFSEKERSLFKQILEADRKRDGASRA